MSEFGDFLKKAGAVSEDLGRSFAHAALQSPIDGASQLFNHIVGHEIIPKVHLINGPKQAAFNRAECYDQQIGSGAGIAFEFLLLGLAGRRTLIGCARLAETKDLMTLISRHGLTHSAT